MVCMSCMSLHEQQKHDAQKARCMMNYANGNTKLLLINSAWQFVKLQKLVIAFVNTECFVWNNFLEQMVCFKRVRFRNSSFNFYCVKIMLHFFWKRLLHHISHFSAIRVHWFLAYTFKFWPANFGEVPFCKIFHHWHWTLKGI